MSMPCRLKNSTYSKNMLYIFKSMYSREALVDVTLTCDGQRLKAHKIVIAACSAFFESLFLENPCKHPIVIFKDIHFTELKIIIDYMYQGELKIVPEQLSAIKKAAETLQVDGLPEIIQKMIDRQERIKANSQTGEHSTPYSSAASTVPLQSSCPSSFMSQPQQDQQILKQNLDTFQHEGKFNTEPTKLLQQSLMTDDLQSRSSRSSVHCNMELQSQQQSSTDQSTSLVPVAHSPMSSDAIVSSQQPKSPPVDFATHSAGSESTRHERESQELIKAKSLSGDKSPRLSPYSGAGAPSLKLRKEKRRKRSVSDQRDSKTPKSRKSDSGIDELLSDISHCTPYRSAASTVPLQSSRPSSFRSQQQQDQQPLEQSRTDQSTSLVPVAPSPMSSDAVVSSQQPKSPPVDFAIDCSGSESAVNNSENDVVMAHTEPTNKARTEDLDAPKILKYLLEGDADDYVMDIYSRKTYNKNHVDFFENIANKSDDDNSIQKAWFGSFENKNAMSHIDQEVLYEHFKNLFVNKVGKKPYIVSYVLQVMIPEAIVKAISDVKNILLEDARLLFESEDSLDEENGDPSLDEIVNSFHTSNSVGILVEQFI